MTSNNININFRSIQAFKNISDSAIKSIENNAEYLKFNFGYPIISPGINTERVFVILSGEARFIHRSPDIEPTTISKLGPDTFLGLSSLFKKTNYDLINASSDVLVLSLSNELITKIYQDNKNFKNWLDNYLTISEIYELVINLKRNSFKNSTILKNTIDLASNSVKISVIENGDFLKLNKDIKTIVSSDNFINKKVGELIIEEQIVKTKGNIAGRLLEIPKNIYNELNDETDSISEANKKPELINIENIDFKETSSQQENQVESFGEYAPKKEFKIIKAKGEVRESIACLKMLSTELDIPFRGDTIEKILLDYIKRGKKLNLQILGGLTTQVLGLHSYLAKVAAKNADRLPVPSIISWKDSYALVKESFSNILEIVSPTEGVLRFNSEQFEEIFPNGYIEVLKVEKSDTTPEKKFGLQWLLPAINRYRGVLIQVLLASFIVQLLGLASPLMIQVIIDKVISQRSLDTLQILGIGLVVLTIFGGVLSSLRIFLFQETTNRIDTKLGAEVIDHLLRLPLKFYDPRPVGELGSRVAELEKIRNFITGQALTTLLDASFSVIYIIVMVFYSWLLTLIALAVVPIQVIITLIGTPLIRGQIREVAQENAKTQSHLVEVLTGIQTVKAQNVERISRWKWQELYSKYISKSFEKTITTTVLSETSKVLQQLSQLLVLWVGATLVLKGELSLGQLIAFRIISGFVTQPLLRLSTIWQNIQELRVSFERLADIIDSPQETTEKDKSKIALPSIKGDVEFDDVSFSFNKENINILKKINLKISQGKFIGIVGQSGSGKSTLMKLLARLYNANSGRILIDGYDISKVELYSLRRQIGIVPQEPLLFAGSVSENIALTDPDTSSEEIVRVAKIANAHNFIMELSNGYSTSVGERGAGLSGGQKQRIAIARTLMTNPKLLIMDEATSALDYSTERKVCEGIRKSCTDSTVFFITHRLSTVRNADLIVMMDQGSIVETGTHEELMNKKERYFALYRQQESS